MATVRGMAAGPANPKEIESKRGGGSRTVLELDVLDDTAGVITVQVWQPKPDDARRLLDVVRGQTVTAIVQRFSAFNAQVRAECEGKDVVATS